MQTIRAKKSLGQNFLIDTGIIDKIISLINPQANDTMVEIGPGRGALTDELIPLTNTLHAIELDSDLTKYLENRYKIDINNAKLHLYNQNALNFDFASIKQTNTKLRVVGNLPYNVATEIIFYLTKFNNISDLHFMLQKEVADRICATPNTKCYGPLGVMLKYWYNSVKLIDVSNDAFYPIPKVTSSIVRLYPNSNKPQVNPLTLRKVVATAFGSRRKTIGNSLKMYTHVLDELNIDKTKRAENLSLDTFVAIANQLDAK